MTAWTQALGDVALTDLTPRGLLLTWNGWRNAGWAVSVAASPDGTAAGLKLTAPAAAAVVDATLSRPRSARSLPRELPHATIGAVLAAMPDRAAGAMLAVMAETGLPPQTIRRLSRGDVGDRLATMRLPPRRKGDRAGAVVRAGAYPPTTAHRQRRPLGPPLEVPTCSPCILRHSFAGRVLDATNGDLQALQALLQHEDIETSLQYTRARVTRSVQGAISALNSQPDPSAGSNRAPITK